MCKELIKKELSTPNCRREYFRQYYLDNKAKYLKEKETRPDMPKKKRGRPKKVIPPFTITTGVFVVSFD